MVGVVAKPRELGAFDAYRKILRLDCEGKILLFILPFFMIDFIYQIFKWPL